MKVLMDKFKELSGGLKLALVIPGALTALFTFWVQFIYPDFDTFKRNTSVEVHVHLDSDHIEPHWTTYRVPCDPYTVTYYINELEFEHGHSSNGICYNFGHRYGENGKIRWSGAGHPLNAVELNDGKHIYKVTWIFSSWRTLWQNVSVTFEDEFVLKEGNTDSHEENNNGN